MSIAKAGDKFIYTMFKIFLMLTSIGLMMTLISFIFHDIKYKRKTYNYISNFTGYILYFLSMIAFFFGIVFAYIFTGCWILGIFSIPYLIGYVGSIIGE